MLHGLNREGGESQWRELDSRHDELLARLTLSWPLIHRCFFARLIASANASSRSNNTNQNLDKFLSIDLDNVPSDRCMFIMAHVSAH